VYVTGKLTTLIQRRPTPTVAYYDEDERGEGQKIGGRVHVNGQLVTHTSTTVCW